MHSVNHISPTSNMLAILFQPPRIISRAQDGIIKHALGKEHITTFFLLSYFLKG